MGKAPSKEEQDRRLLGATWKIALLVVVVVLAVLLAQAAEVTQPMR